MAAEDGQSEYQVESLTGCARELQCTEHCEYVKKPMRDRKMPFYITLILCVRCEYKSV